MSHFNEFQDGHEGHDHHDFTVVVLEQPGEGDLLQIRDNGHDAFDAVVNGDVVRLHEIHRRFFGVFHHLPEGNQQIVKLHVLLREKIVGREGDPFGRGPGERAEVFVLLLLQQVRDGLEALVFLDLPDELFAVDEIVVQGRLVAFLLGQKFMGLEAHEDGGHH